MKIEDFTFAVAEDELKLSDGKTLDKFKAIVRVDNWKPISVVRDSYTLYPNGDAIAEVLQVLELERVKYRIDKVNSYISDSRMILTLILQEEVVHDGTSPVAMTITLHNSYDMTSAVRYTFGHFRFVCSNGALFRWEGLAEEVKRHTEGLLAKDFQVDVVSALHLFPKINDKFKALASVPVSQKQIDNSYQIMGKRYENHVKDNLLQHNLKTVYDLYNLMTWYTSHKIIHTQREQYLKQISEAFKI